MRDKVNQELDKLVAEGILVPVPHSEWAAPIVPILKSDGHSISICGDYKVTVNREAKTDAYLLPRINDLFANLSGGKVFSNLDLVSAYQQIELDEDSKQYTTINTSRGLFQYNRLPFGISTAPSIFQRIMENVLRDLPGVTVYLDDILISGSDMDNHFRNLEGVLQRLQEAGLTLKEDKCAFALPSVEYLGHTIDGSGLHPSPRKVKAIQEAPEPKNLTELRSFIGLLNYYTNFIPNLSCFLFPFYRLMQKGVRWTWTTEHKQLFNRAKNLLQSSALLTHFDPNKQLIVAADASPIGVGGVLSHIMEDGSEQPIAFVSRSLSPAERKYSQIDKEGLAIVFAVKKFHPYLHGRTFNIYSDHQPLKHLFDETRQVPTLASARIQRWALLLAAYNYTIRYRPGKAMANADALSRLPLPETIDHAPEPGEHIALINHLDQILITSLHIKQWTDSDPVLSRVRRFTQYGWTDCQEDEPQLSPYQNRQSELSVLNGCVLLGARVVIPPQGQEIILKQLHEGHPRVSKMKALARSFVWWPRLDSAIEACVRNCSTCQEHRPSPTLAPLHPWEWPNRPWARIHIDHAGPFLGHLFLLIVDAHSKWIEAHIVPSTSAEATISQLQEVFATHGYPEQIISDNGTGFASAEFQIYTKTHGILHTFTAPYHPSSNGMAERSVQTMKQALKKLQGPISERLSQFLFHFRTTPQTTTGLSPA